MTETVLRHCAPTLAGIKTGSLINCPRDEAWGWLWAVKPMLNRCHLEAVLIESGGARALLYIYRPSRLRQDFSGPEVQEFLKAHGYDPSDIDACVKRLADQLRASQTFPHEVGLFLGYPFSDVLGFIQHCGRSYKCSGCWKVYGDQEGAQRAFSMYKTCTRCMLKGYYSGKTLDQLIVAC